MFMKKLIAVFIVMAVILFSFNVFAQAQSSWSVKLGIDFASSIDIAGAGYDTGMGYNLTGEYLMPYRNSFNIGAGMTYQLDRDFENYLGNDGEFGFTPFYGLVEYILDNGPVYFIGHLGFSSLRVNHPAVNDSSGGLYYALGAGMYITDQYTADLLLTKNSGEIDGEDVDHSKLTVSVGMKF